MPDTEAEPAPPHRRRRQASGDHVRARPARRARRRPWRRSATSSRRAADPPRRAAWYCWAGFLHSLTGARPGGAHRLLPRGVGDRGRERPRRDPGVSPSAASRTSTCWRATSGRPWRRGSARSPIFEARGNVWWACRTLWGLSMAANASGEWARSLECCRRALEHGKALNDLRLKVVGWWRTGSTHVQRGDVEAGLRCYEEALALSPIPFDAAMARAGRAYGLVKAGEVAAGDGGPGRGGGVVRAVEPAFHRSSSGAAAGRGLPQDGRASSARAVAGDGVLATCREFGHRHLEGVAQRLLGEVLAADDRVRRRSAPRGRRSDARRRGRAGRAGEGARGPGKPASGGRRSCGRAAAPRARPGPLRGAGDARRARGTRRQPRWPPLEAGLARCR